MPGPAKPGPDQGPEEAAILTMAWVEAGQPGTAVSLLKPEVTKPDPEPNLLLLFARAALKAGQPFHGEVVYALERLSECDESELAELAAVTLRLREAEDHDRQVTSRAIVNLASLSPTEPAPRTGWDAEVSTGFDVRRMPALVLCPPPRFAN